MHMATPTKYASSALVDLIDLTMRQYDGVSATTCFCSFLSLDTHTSALITYKHCMPQDSRALNHKFPLIVCCIL